MPNQDTRLALIGGPVPCLVFRVPALDTQRVDIREDGAGPYDSANCRIVAHGRGRVPAACLPNNQIGGSPLGVDQRAVLGCRNRCHMLALGRASSTHGSARAHLLGVCCGRWRDAWWRKAMQVVLHRHADAGRKAKTGHRFPGKRRRNKSTWTSRPSNLGNSRHGPGPRVVASRRKVIIEPHASHESLGRISSQQAHDGSMMYSLRPTFRAG